MYMSELNKLSNTTKGWSLVKDARLFSFITTNQIHR